jgi:hypothetical protein
MSIGEIVNWMAFSKAEAQEFGLFGGDFLLGVLSRFLTRITRMDE